MAHFNPPSDTATEDELFTAFTEQFSRGDLFETAIAYMGQIQDISPLALESCEGGLMGRIIQNLLSRCPRGPELSKRLMDHYEFTEQTVPPRLVFRELLRLEVHRNILLERLGFGKLGQDSMTLAFIEAGLLELTGDMTDPSQVLSIPDTVLDELISNMHVMEAKGS